MSDTRRCATRGRRRRRAAREGAESQTALLAATGICLQERAGGFSDQGMFREAAELRGGKFLETVTRMQAHGLRAKPDVLLPNVYDSIAALYLRAKETKKGLGFLYRAVASTACTERYGDKYVPEGEARGLRALASWDAVLASVVARLQEADDRWRFGGGRRCRAATTVGSERGGEEDRRTIVSVWR